MLFKQQKLIKKVLVGFLIIKISFALIYLSGSLVTTAVFAADDDKKTEESADDKKKDAKGEKEETDEEKEKKKEKKISDVLSALEEKRAAIRIEEQRLALKKAQLEAMKQELEQKIEQMTQIQIDIDASLTKIKAIEKKKNEKNQQKALREEINIKKLVKVYSSMKPKNAAKIIDNLDMAIAEKIFKAMKGDKAGSILSYVEPKRAATISKMLAELDPEVKTDE